MKVDVAHIGDLPAQPGVYAIVNTATGERYVGQAKAKAGGIRNRVREHVRNLIADAYVGTGFRLLQTAWDTYGSAAFGFEVLELVEDNTETTVYAIRPDNLSLAEHYYINERAELNVDKRIVRDGFEHLIERRAWREKAFDDETQRKLAEALPYVYVVTERVTGAHAVIVSAFNEQEAKQKAARASEIIRGLGGAVSSKRISATRAQQLIAEGVQDARATS